MSQETDSAYFAGILDGEGCFYISKNNRISPVHKSIEYQAKLYVVNTDKVLIDWIVAHFGGLWYTRKPSKPHWKVKYEWCIHAAQAIELTNLVLPYLVIKKPHAEWFLKFHETVRRKTKMKGTHQLSADILFLRETCYLAVKELNHRNEPTRSS